MTFEFVGAMPSERSDVGMLTLRESMPPLISSVIDHYKQFQNRLGTVPIIPRATIRRMVAEEGHRPKVGRDCPLSAAVSKLLLFESAKMVHAKARRWN
jgi:hypothetical protein